MKSFSTEKKVVPSLNSNVNSSMRQFNPDSNINIESKREFHYSLNKMRNQMNLNGSTTNFNNSNNFNNNLINGNLTTTSGNIVNNADNNININNNICINNNINGNANITNNQYNYFNSPNLLQNNPRNTVNLNRFKSTNSSQGFKYINLLFIIIYKFFNVYKNIKFDTRR